MKPNKNIECVGGSYFLRSLEGRDLAGVTFIRDYAQLLFDGPILNVYKWPIVIDDAGRHEFSSPSYRDRLCALIGTNVVRAVVEPDKALSLTFDDGRSLVIALDESDPEAVEFRNDAAREWGVW